jgi:DNA-binding transcriptional LysR family regulator
MGKWRSEPSARPKVHANLGTRLKFDLTDLRLLLHIVEAGSITAGAERAHLSLAAASERMRGMEANLGLPLLLRSHRGVRPSAAGDTVVHHARLVFQQLARLEAELGDHAGGLQGTVRLLCNTAALSEYLPDALARFMVRHPGVDLDIEERTSADVAKGVRDGSADIGIAADTVDLSGLETFPFCTDRLVAVATPALARQLAGEGSTPVAFASLLSMDHIGLAGDSALSRYLAQQAASSGRVLRTRARVRSFDAICRMVGAGIGVGIVPQAAGTCVGAAQAGAVRAQPGRAAPTGAATGCHAAGVVARQPAILGRNDRNRQFSRAPLFHTAEAIMPQASAHWRQACAHCWQ